MATELNRSATSVAASASDARTALVRVVEEKSRRPAEAFVRLFSSASGVEI